MNLSSIRRRIKAMEEVFRAEVEDNPFGERTAEVLLQVYLEELDKVITEDDNPDYSDFLTITELKKRLAETPVPVKIRRDINKQMSRQGLMTDETLQELIEYFKEEK